MVRQLGLVLSASFLLASVVYAADSTGTAPTAPATNAQPKLRCKRYVETGSLAKVNKECHTDAEWQQMAVQGREQARGMMNTISRGQQPQ